jgi:hypothetical protein
MFNNLIHFIELHWKEILVVIAWFKTEITSWVPRIWAFLQQNNGLRGTLAIVMGNKITKKENTNEKSSVS